jgi:hypothetical protein
MGCCGGDKREDVLAGIGLAPNGQPISTAVRVVRRFTVEQAKAASRSRQPGYLDAIAAACVTLPDGRLEIEIKALNAIQLRYPHLMETSP